ncbi:immune inhibitor A domain-containing protein [Simiduia aestuariiviva]|uniref:Immune inhibitor A n=1 Tax=Simiduia aestuariiviva TaxID=1510459 RepID=A0A839UQ46_9GAMM|nr:immune inhibitor A domain-containing protein [Simiduia aestuariiviva]MBB3167527.1 immune inhibitor A [Simiduia aestuariiviva]
MLKPLHALSLGALLLSTASVAAPTPTHASGPFDLAIANEDRLLDMLRASGKIPATASMAEAEAAVKSYLRERQEAERAKHKWEASPFAKNKSAKLKQSMMNGKGNKLGQAKKNAPANMTPEAYDGEKRTAKVLAILMDFQDFKHNDNQPADTAMYYADYAASHYADLLFGETYAGPNGESLITMRSHYEQQSGGSYSVEGSVAGWYTASQNAAYYGNNANGNARALIKEALMAASADPSINLADFDQEDRYDLDGDGNFWEPDGLVDHIMVFHASVGEEAGGGQLGEDAIWSHRWNLGGVFPTGTPSNAPYWGGMMSAYDYTIQPADAAAGVATHEYGHDLGLPDEYDTQYTGAGEPVSYWSIMSSGSWAGTIPGTEPTGFSAWSKEFLQNSLGGNWLHGATVHSDDIPAGGYEALLDQAASKGTNNDAIRIDLPLKEVVIAQPTSGEFAYYSGSGNNLENAMYAPVNLTGASEAKLTFKAWLDIEQDWDYGYVMVFDQNFDQHLISGNISSNTNPYGQNFGGGFTGNSNGWVDAEFDLSAFAGQQIYVMFYYWTDGYVANPGFYADDIVITADGNNVLADNADSNNQFALDGFSVNNGKSYNEHYYLVEWRTHQGVDQGLAHVMRGGQPMPFNEGMLVWYVDNGFTDNWTGVHPGDGFLGVVDADQHTVTWNDGEAASTRYQIHDAAFSLEKTPKLFLDFSYAGFTLKDNFTKRNPLFDDGNSYMSADMPDAGRKVVPYGLKLRVVGQSADKSVGKILIYK